MKKICKQWGIVILLIIIFIAYVYNFDVLKPSLYKFFGQSGKNEVKYSLPKMTLDHLSIVMYSSSFSVVIGLGLGILSTLEIGREVRGLFEKLTYLGQMLPTIAILTFLVSFTGFGAKPAIIALVVSGIMPIYINTVTGIESVPKEMIEVADSLGMSEWKKLKMITIPMALPVIISGLRTALIINISAATLAYRVGAGGLGIILFSSLRGTNNVYIVEATVTICLLAIITDRILKNIEDIFSGKLRLR